MKAAISYKCTCGQGYLVCVHRNEPADCVDEWRTTVAGIAQQLHVELIDAPNESFKCARCGKEHHPAGQPAEYAAPLLSQ
jgi:DNA-directed RNA polymerase subunit RPC12/RpoP